MSAEETFQAAQEAAALFSLPEHLLFFAQGPDALRYLHGRLTQDIQGISEGSGAHSLLLSPQGKILGHCFVLRMAEGLYLVADPGSGEEAFLADLLKFKVADQLEVVPRSASHALYSLQGPRSADILESLGVTVPDDPLAHSDTSIGDIPILLIAHQRGLTPGFDIVASKEHGDSLAEQLTTASPLSAIEGTQEAFEILRITAGTPQAGKDLSDKVIATDIDIEKLVSFEKGCYAGQEVVEMSIARGRPNRRFARLTVQADAPIAVGTSVTYEAKSCGSVTSSCFLPTLGESRCLAFIKTSIPEDAPLCIADVQCQIS